MERAAQLEAAAKAMGMTVPAYVELLKNSQQRGHNATFNDGAVYMFKKYPQTLKKLAE